jgi:hypothetical protein
MGRQQREGVLTGKGLEQDRVSGIAGTSALGLRTDVPSLRFSSPDGCGFSILALMARPPPNLPHAEVFRQLLELLNERAADCGMQQAAVVPKHSLGGRLASTQDSGALGWDLHMQEKELVIFWGYGPLTLAFLPVPPAYPNGKPICYGDAVSFTVQMKDWDEGLLRVLKRLAHKPIKAADVDF